MATMTIPVSSHTFISNKAQTADYSMIIHPRTDSLFRDIIYQNKWDEASNPNYIRYVEATILRFERPVALKYSRISSATLHIKIDGLWYSAGYGWGSDVFDRCFIATYTTDNAMSAISWSNFRTNGILGDFVQSGTAKTIASPVVKDIPITALYSGDLSASEFTLLVSYGSPTADPDTYGRNSVIIEDSYLSVVYEPATQPAPTPLYPKDQTIIEAASTLFTWQFNSDTEAVQASAELQYKNVEDDNYTTVSLTQATPSYLLQTALPVGSYQWRVKVTNDAGTTSSYSEVAYFNIIGRPASPIINEPENKTLTEITWNTVDQQSCEVILKDAAGNELYHETLAKSEANYRPNFFLDGSYLFSVRVMNGSAMWSDWGQRAFTISAVGPDAATLALVTVAGDPAVNLSYTLPDDVSAVLMRSLADGSEEKVVAHLESYETTYRDDTVAANQNYKYWIRTYVDGYTDTAKIAASVSFEGCILNGSGSWLNLSISDEKFPPHTENISRELALMKFSGREFPMSERDEFTTVEISRRFYVSEGHKKALDGFCKEDRVFYRDTKGNAFPVAIKSIEYTTFMDDGYLGSFTMVRLGEEEVQVNV